MLFLNPSILRGMAGLVAMRMAEISSLLEVKNPKDDSKHPFPVGS